MRRSGVRLLDEVLGGLAPALPLVVTGPAGTGRTLLCLQLAAAYTERGECTVFLTEEPPALLLRQAASLGLDLESAVRDGRLVLLELQAQAAAHVRGFGTEALVEAIHAEAPRARLLLIDPVTSLTSELIGEGKQRAAVHALFEGSAELGQITVVTAESDRLHSEPALMHALESLCGVFLALERTPLGARVLSVSKSRMPVHADGPVPFEIGPGGLTPAEARVGELPPGLSAPARPQSPPARASTPKETPQGVRSGPDAAEPSGREKILVVEDDRVTLEMLRDWLAKRYDVITAEDGFDAVSAVLSQRPALIVLDLVLPRVSGFEVIRALRSSGAMMPILVVSGSLARSGDRVRVLVLGATDMLAKPVQRFELLRKVETLLQLPVAPTPEVELADVDRLLFAKSATRILSEDEFHDRLERACRFGTSFGLASSLVFVETPSSDVLDVFLGEADQTLRLEDAVLAVPKRRAVLLLVATELQGVQPALTRIGKRLVQGGVDLLGMRWRALPAEAREGPDWGSNFVDLQPWPGEEKSRTRRKRPGGKS